MQKIKYIPAERLIAIAEQLYIVNRYKGGQITPWKLTQEQKIAALAAEKGGRVFFIKPRQVGLSTIWRLFELLLTAVNDAAGNRFYAGVYIDTSDKAKKQFLETKDFVRQLGLECKINNSEYSFTFPNGSILEYNSAMGNRAGASATYHYIRVTELPYFKPSPSEVFSGLMSTLIPGGTLAIETTLNHEEFSRGLWENRNDIRKIFFPFESHEAYRMDPDSEKSYLTEEWEEKLRKEGFTRRDAMAYWLHILYDLHGGDEIKTWREYPQKPEHSWRFAEGLWIHLAPEVLEPLRLVEVRGTHKIWKVDVFKEPEKNAEYVIGVDIAGGHGKDHSAVVVVDKRDNSITACFTSDLIKGDDLLEVIHVLQSEYTVPHGPKQSLPDIIMESNGIGQKYYQDALNRLRGVQEEVTTQSSQYEVLVNTKRMVESRVAFGPARLAEEAASLHSTETQKFGGKKDLCMALGFCYKYIKTHPYRPPRVELAPGRFYYADRIPRR